MKSYARRELDENPGWQNTSGGVYWTPQRVLDAMVRHVSETTGLLPNDSDVWNAIKAGRLDLPTAANVLREFGSMYAAWMAAGASRDRLSPGNRPWTEEEITYLLDHAGDMSLKAIAGKLHRTWPACKRKLYDLGTTARDAQGYMSAQQVADEYGCTLNHVQRLIARGVLRAHRPRSGQRWWLIAPEDAQAISDQLRYDESPPLDAFERWLTLREAASRVGLTYSALHRYVCDGELPSVRRGRRHFIAERHLRRFKPRSMRVAS